MAQSLEQEALDRVARMYSSYDRRGHRGNPPSPEKPEPIPQPEEPPAENPIPPQEKTSAGLLDYLMQDKEQSLIMLLLVILMKDGADMSTVLALMYILL